MWNNRWTNALTVADEKSFAAFIDVSVKSCSTPISLNQQKNKSFTFKYFVGSIEFFFYLSQLSYTGNREYNNYFPHFVIILRNY